MRVLIVSDTHGHEENLERILTEKGPFQHLIHLGDVEGQEDYIEVIAGCLAYCGSGNNDFFRFAKRGRLWIKIIIFYYPWTLLWGFCGNTGFVRKQHFEMLKWQCMDILI